MRALETYVPKRLQPYLRDIYKDCDGYWATFREGVENMDGGRTANGLTIAELRRSMADIQKVVD